MDRLDDAIDEFERSWSDETAAVETVLQRHNLADDPEAVAEVIRVDIEFRSDKGLPTEVGDYLERFPILRANPATVAEIAYEDYRCRAVNGLAVPPSRWSGLPGVSQQNWYRELASGAVRQNRQRASLQSRLQVTEDLAFVAALEEAGFELVQQIGSGAFSQVYLATQSELADRYVVLKIVNQPLSEPQHMALLQHTNIVPIYSFHRIFSRCVICMPYTGSLTLQDYLSNKSDVSMRGGQSLVQTVKSRISDTRREFNEESNVPVKDLASLNLPAADDAAVLTPLATFSTYSCNDLALWIFQRLSGALAHAHARGVVHYDLKPSNVLIRNDGEPALLDFNLSQTTDDKTPRHAGGTLPYMSPEAYRALMGQSEPPRPTSDVYGLGVMLFEFVTGRLPFPNPASPAAVDLGPALQARREAPGWKADDPVTPGIRSIIDRCLRFDPQDRYQSADDLRADLQCEQQDLSLVHSAEPATSRIRKWTRRHPRLISAGSVTALLLALLVPIAFGAVQSRRDNARLSALASYKEFSDRSEEFFSALMADPDRQSEDNIRDATAVLQRYDLLGKDGIERMLSCQDPVDVDRVRDQIRRHLIQVAILESSRLSQLRLADPVAARDFGRLDPLLRAADIVDEGSEDRASLFLQAKRAKLTEDVETAEKLFARAAALPIESDSDVYLEAVRLIGEFDFDTARELLTTLADRGSIPTALRWTLLGQTQFHDGQFDDAKISFSQSIERAPGSVPLRVWRGRCHHELGETDSAIRDYVKAKELKPDAEGPWFQLGSLYFDQGLDQDALECFDQVVKLNPDRIAARILRSKIYRRLGQTDAAQSELQTAMATECDDPWQLIARAKARRNIQPEEALRDFERAVVLNPDRPFFQQELAEYLAYPLGRHEEAIEMFAKVLQAQPDNESAQINRGLSYVRLGKTDLGLRDAKIAMAGSNAPANIYQAACLHALIDREVNQRRAVTLLAAALRAGFDPDGLLEDPDLQSLHERDDFKAVVQVYQIGDRFARGRPQRNKGS